MKVSCGSLLGVVACMAMNVAHAQVITYVAGKTVSADGSEGGWALQNAYGGGTLQFSKTLIDALNTTRSTLAVGEPADLQVTTTSSTSGSGVVTTRLATVSLAAPMTSLTGDFGDRTVTVQDMSTQGGFSLATTDNGATDGEGFLSISNLRVDWLTRRVYADIEGGNGVGSISGYHLWSFYAPSAPLVITVSGYLTPGYTHSSNESVISGLFASTEAMNLIDQALNLNGIGRSAWNTVNNPLKGSGLGFGSISLAVPEPSTYALLMVGGLCAGWMARRRRA